MTSGKSIYLVILVLLFGRTNIAQPSNIGNPLTINFLKKNTKAGTQTWAIEEDELGYVWFANNAGLVKFDGYRWDVLPLPNGTIVRSLGVENKTHRVYVGSQGDFGYFSPDLSGIYQYTSLVDLLPQKFKAFGEVWSTLITQYGVFFRTDHQVFWYNEGKLSVLFPEGRYFNFIAIWGKEVVLQDGNNKLYTFYGNRFSPRKRNPSFNEGKISSVINLSNGQVLIATLYHGIFYETDNGFLPWKTDNDTYFEKMVIYCASKLKGDKIILGTSYDGAIIIDNNRRIETHINKKTSLQNNTVLSIGTTASGNIWLGLDNGIDLLHLNSAFREFFPDNDLQGTGYTLDLFNNDLYLGTNTGLYKIPWKIHYEPWGQKHFSAIKNTSGQVWKLQHFDDQLWMAHHEGAFSIKGNLAQKVDGTSGVWKFIPLAKDRLLVGHYEGLITIKKSNKTWINESKIDGLSESSRILDTDDNQNLWVSHPYRGIYRISYAELLNLKTSDKLFKPSNANNLKIKNQIYKINQKLITADDNKLYEIDPQTLGIQPEKTLNNYIHFNKDLKFLHEDEYKNIWYATQRETGMLIPQKSFSPEYKKYIINELNGRLTEGFQTLLTIDKDNVIFPTEKGFLHFNPSAYINDQAPVFLFISKVLLKKDGDSTIYQGYEKSFNRSYNYTFPPEQNNIEIQLSVKDYPNKEVIYFSYSLNNTGFTEWNNVPDISFNQLPPGKYHLKIKAKNQANVESNQILFNITILPPWYFSTLAYFSYGLISILTLVWLSKRQKKKHVAERTSIIEESQEREREHQLAARQSREKIIRLQNEKLQAEIDFKNQELTSFTYHLVNKNELIGEIKKAINRLGPKLETDKELKKEFKNIIQLTEQNDDIDADWANFVKNFDQVHADFFKRLTSKYGDLSPNDYKMCTYLRMNLTSKEIAALMNISIRSVETNRYRLRKKLGLLQDENLTQFLLKF
jgi:ligand-binding sensor domain-containing protein/DNA-binding CsgD family transcriptional regulator